MFHELGHYAGGERLVQRKSWPYLGYWMPRKSEIPLQNHTYRKFLALEEGYTHSRDLWRYINKQMTTNDIGLYSGRVDGIEDIHYWLETASEVFGKIIENFKGGDFRFNPKKNSFDFKNDQAPVSIEIAETDLYHDQYDRPFVWANISSLGEEPFDFMIPLIGIDPDWFKGSLSTARNSTAKISTYNNAMIELSLQLQSFLEHNAANKAYVDSVYDLYQNVQKEFQQKNGKMELERREWHLNQLRSVRLRTPETRPRLR